MNLDNLYLWIKAGHIIAVIFWMAALLYLPRLFVYHVKSLKNKENHNFEIMEKRLLKFIMTPAMFFAWFFAIFLFFLNSGVFVWSEYWAWIKISSVLILSVFHMWCAKERKRLLKGKVTYSLVTYRFVNEIPALLAVIIIISIIVRPF